MTWYVFYVKINTQSQLLLTYYLFAVDSQLSILALPLKAWCYIPYHSGQIYVVNEALTTGPEALSSLTR